MFPQFQVRKNAETENEVQSSAKELNSTLTPSGKAKASLMSTENPVRVAQVSRLLNIEATNSEVVNLLC